MNLKLFKKFKVPILILVIFLIFILIYTLVKIKNKEDYVEKNCLTVTNGIANLSDECEHIVIPEIYFELSDSTKLENLKTITLNASYSGEGWSEHVINVESKSIKSIGVFQHKDIDAKKKEIDEKDFMAVYNMESPLVSRGNQLSFIIVYENEPGNSGDFCSSIEDISPSEQIEDYTNTTPTETDVNTKTVNVNFNRTPWKEAGGNRVMATLPNDQGDFISQIILEVVLPKNGSDNQLIEYSSNIYSRLIEQVELEINGQRIDRQYDYNIHYMALEEGRKGKKRFIAETDTRTFKIPLPFWFCKRQNNALPIISLDNSKVKIIIEFSSTTNLIENENHRRNLSMISAHLNVKYISLDSDQEKNKWKQTPFEMSIEQLQFTGKETVDALKNYADLPVYNRFDGRGSRERYLTCIQEGFGLDKLAKEPNASDQILQDYETYKGECPTGLYFNHQITKLIWFVLPSGSDISNYFNFLYENKNIITNTKIQLDDDYIIDKSSSETEQQGLGNTPTGIHVLNLDPPYRPSPINNQFIKIDFDETYKNAGPSTDLQSINLYVFAFFKNVLVFKDGLYNFKYIN